MHDLEENRFLMLGLNVLNKVFRLYYMQSRFTNLIKRLRFFCLFGQKGWVEGGVIMNIHGQIVVGTNCKIGKDTKINIAKGGQLKIEDNVFIGANCQIEVEKKVIIESGVTISDNVYLADVTHTFPTVSGSGVRELLPMSVTRISKGCWLGRNVVVNPGCSIASYNLIAANAVVAKSISESWGLHGGVPARLLRKDLRRDP